MQEAAFSDLKIKAFYLPFELEPRVFQKTLRHLSPEMLDGFNVTVPFKEAVMPYLGGLAPEAKRIGAVNTVFRKAGHWTGANTDVYGFLTSLKKEAAFVPQGKSALLLGAGGSARAVAYGLAEEKMSRIVLINRRSQKAEKMIQDFDQIFPKVEWLNLSVGQADWKHWISESDLIVNATSVGLKPGDHSLIPPSAIAPARALKKRKLFYDLIYQPVETDFLKQAKRKGHFTLNGLGMLLFQGAKSFEYWTERKAPVETMRTALSQALKGVSL